MGGGERTRKVFRGGTTGGDLGRILDLLAEQIVGESWHVQREAVLQTEERWPRRRRTNGRKSQSNRVERK